MTVTADYGFEINSTPALLMGPGTSYKIAHVTGLSLPPVRSHDIPKIGDGVYAARDALGPRTISLDLRITTSSASALTAAILTFLTAWQSTNTDVTLTWKLPGFSGTNRYVNGRPRGAVIPIDYREFQKGFIVQASAEFFCQDPRIFLTGGTTPTVF